VPVFGEFDISFAIGCNETMAVHFKATALLLSSCSHPSPSPKYLACTLVPSAPRQTGLSISNYTHFNLQLCSAAGLLWDYCDELHANSRYRMQIHGIERCAVHMGCADRRQNRVLFGAEQSCATCIANVVPSPRQSILYKQHVSGKIPTLHQTLIHMSGADCTVHVRTPYHVIV